MKSDILYFKCGQVLKPHGIKGELKIKSLSDFDRFHEGSNLFIFHNGEYVKVQVETSRPFGDFLLIRFKDLDNINLIEKYHSDYIFVHKDDREELDNEYYYNELIDKIVINQNEIKKGIVTDIIEYPQAKYLEVNIDGKKKLIPFIDEFIIEVTDDYIKVKEIEGLFWKLKSWLYSLKCMMAFWMNQLLKEL